MEKDTVITGIDRIELGYARDGGKMVCTKNGVVEISKTIAPCDRLYIVSEVDKFYMQLFRNGIPSVSVFPDVKISLFTNDSEHLLKMNYASGGDIIIRIPKSWKILYSDNFNKQESVQTVTFTP